ncbi:hypothetical protein [Taibaiella chishuiensis]|uniref:Uncharacterized protein n=1 Tax=Taibaiella chishuiensis TaxID=1434707 RepID=A0A2P8CVX1_9BACT|nr:hypothetical protein [Taibaiella chishuiensis]PSK89114.1 hypothetical protein B0I18_113126 [Taibaiella chishuiensis]
MKKTLLAALLGIGSFMTANASYIYFFNMTNCDFNFNVDGAIGTTGRFAANNVIIPPGNTYFFNPSQLPGVVQFGTGSLVSGHGEAIKGYDVGGPYSFVVGISPLYPTLPTSYNSASNSYYPACYNNTAYVVSFANNGNGDVVVLIN